MGEAARQQRRALRLAAGRRPRHRGLRAGDRGAASRSPRANGSPHWAGLRPADGDPPAPAAAPALARPAARPRRQPQAPRRPARRRSASPASLGVGLTALAARKIGVDNVVESIVRSDVTWVLIAFGLMVALALLPRRLLVLDRPRRAAQPARPPPRRHLGDDDRRADVGDPAGAPRRAGPGAVALAPHRARCARPSRSCSAPSSRRRCSTSSPCCCSA